LEVCQKSDFIGSTEAILTKVRNAEPNSSWLVGTELNLVNRLSAEMKEKNVSVQFMSPTLCMCSTMFRIDPQHLSWVLENLANGHVVNQIQVPATSSKLAKLALTRMLTVS
jgi:quinolinate synthase